VEETARGEEVTDKPKVYIEETQASFENICCEARVTGPGVDAIRAILTEYPKLQVELAQVKEERDKWEKEATAKSKRLCGVLDERDEAESRLALAEPLLKAAMLSPADGGGYCYSDGRRVLAEAENYRSAILKNIKAAETRPEEEKEGI
jgi:hypothetical protein